MESIIPGKVMTDLGTITLRRNTRTNADFRRTAAIGGIVLVERLA